MKGVHTRLVRSTHRVNTVAVIALLVSGLAILLAHPRFYWGETGAFGSPALLDLPWPANLEHSGWGRSLHFLAAGVCVVNGSLYALRGIANGHFAGHMTPFGQAGLLGKARPAGLLREARPAGLLREARPAGLLREARPAGLLREARPTESDSYPIVDLFGGHQSARTIHGLAAVLLLLFLVVHVVMVYRAGLTVRMRRMIAG